jgi:tetrapyrrole methylase family protein/MazG family protein/ATP diphosphatase
MTEKAIDRLLDIMARLRDPDCGCPWDREQDFATIAPYTIEEAYEVADAISRDDMAALKDELGDLLFQVVFHSRMAEERGEFAFDDVAEAISDKMLRRHPYVFGSAEMRSADAQTMAWETHKAEERKGQGTLDGIALALPALLRAIKLQNRAARVGFDWPSLVPVMDKLREELGEIEHEIEIGGSPDRLEDEIGDLLFVVANIARHLKLDPEAALRRTNAKFERRFRLIEQKLAIKGKTPSQSSLDEMDALWEEAKAEERPYPSTGSG